MLVGWHKLFSRSRLDPDGGAAWALSIIGLTLVIRAALIPLFVKQIKSSRNMQLIQPKVKELQKKYGHDRERLAAGDDEALQGDGHQPVRVLPADPAADADLLRAVPAARPGGHARQGATGFLTATAGRAVRRRRALRRAALATRSSTPTATSACMIVAAVLVVAMTATTFLTQRQLMSKNMPADALTGPYAQQQKMLLYVLPVVFAVGGIAFPIGVLLYWTTSNLWTMGQQFYVIRNNPAPGHRRPFAAKEERDAAKAAKGGRRRAACGRRRGGGRRRAEAAGADRRPPQRQQPQDDSPGSQRKKPAGGPADASPKPETRRRPAPTTRPDQQ